MHVYLKMHVRRFHFKYYFDFYISKLFGMSLYYFFQVQVNKYQILAVFNKIKQFTVYFKLCKQVSCIENVKHTFYRLHAVSHAQKQQQHYQMCLSKAL